MTNHKLILIAVLTNFKEEVKQYSRHHNNNSRDYRTYEILLRKVRESLKKIKVAEGINTISAMLSINKYANTNDFLLTEEGRTTLTRLMGSLHSKVAAIELSITSGEDVDMKILGVSNYETDNKNTLYILNRFAETEVIYIGIHKGDSDKRRQGHFTPGKSSETTKKTKLIKHLKTNNQLKYAREINLVEVLSDSRERVMLGEYYLHQMTKNIGIEHFLNEVAPTIPANLDLTDIDSQIADEPPLPLDLEGNLAEVAARVTIFLDRYTVDSEKLLTGLLSEMDLSDCNDPIIACLRDRIEEALSKM